LTSGRQDLARVSAQLEALNPLAVLARGYSVTYDAAGKIIESAEDVGIGDIIRTRFKDGEVNSEVVNAPDLVRKTGEE